MPASVQPLLDVLSAAVPSAATLLAFTVAGLVLFVTPGPDMSLFLARTLQGGRRAGLASMLGANLGIVAHTALVAVGLSAVILASPTAFAALKIVGGGYLLWLAFDAIRRGSSLSVRSENAPPPSFARAFWVGLSVNLSNPKVVLFFMTFLPQFVAADDPHAGAKLVFLGLFFVVAISVPLGVVMVLGAERVIGALRARPRVLRAIDYLFAGVFGAFALKIFTAQAR